MHYSGKLAAVRSWSPDAVARLDDLDSLRGLDGLRCTHCALREGRAAFVAQLVPWRLPQAHPGPRRHRLPGRPHPADGLVQSCGLIAVTKNAVSAASMPPLLGRLSPPRAMCPTLRTAMDGPRWTCSAATSLSTRRRSSTVTSAGCRRGGRFVQHVEHVEHVKHVPAAAALRHLERLPVVPHSLVCPAPGPSGTLR